MTLYPNLAHVDSAHDPLGLISDPGCAGIGDRRGIADQMPSWRDSGSSGDGRGRGLFVCGSHAPALRVITESLKGRPQTQKIGALTDSVATAASLSPKLAVTIAEAAQLLSISRSHLYPIVMRGEIPSFHIGRSHLIRVSALEAWIQRQEERAA